MAKLQRLAKKNDFDAVFKKGKSLKNDFLVVKMLKNNLKESRFGFVVSKKVSAKATVRNKVRRRLRDAVAKVNETIKTPIDVAVVALPGIEKREFLEISAAIKFFLQKNN